MQYIMIDDDGDKFYYKDKNMTELHREDGPAVEYADGIKAWYLHGKHHREDGPAIERVNGKNSWYLHDEYYTEAEFNAKMNSCNNKEVVICNNKEVVIDGKTYILKLKGELKD